MSEQLLFFGFLAEKAALQEAFAKEMAPQVSAVKFQTALLEGLCANGIEVTIVAALPISTFPRTSKIFVKGKYFNLSPDMRGVLPFSINLPLVKLGLRLWSSLYYGKRMLLAGKGRSGIIVYSAHAPYVAAALLLKKRFGVPFSVFIPDLPMYMAGRKLTGAHRLLKALDDWLLRRMIAKADVVFPITKALADDWLPGHRRSVVIEGIGPTGVLSNPISVSGKRCLLYTGSFSYVLKAVRMFTAHREIDAKWTMVGDGPDREELVQMAQSDSRLIIKPFATGVHLEREFAEADFLINPRDTLWEGARYSFPSKLFDYMARGLPIISTRLPGIPDEYFKCFIDLDDRNELEFASSLSKALATDEAEIKSRIALGQRLLATEKSPKAVGARILEALRTC